LHRRLHTDLLKGSVRVRGLSDTGFTFAAAARTVNAQLDSLPFAKGDELFAVLSDLKSRQMGGSSGV